MPLLSDFEIKLRIQLGLTAPSIAEQTRAVGLELSNPELWEQRHRAWNLLRIGGFITDHEASLVAGRLIKAIGLDVGYQQAIANLQDEVYESIDTTQTRADVARVFEAFGCPIPASADQGDEPAMTSTLDAYLQERSD